MDGEISADEFEAVTLESVGTTRPDQPFGVTAGTRLTRLSVGSPAFLYNSKSLDAPGLNLDEGAELEFVA